MPDGLTRNAIGTTRITATTEEAVSGDPDAFRLVYDALAQPLQDGTIHELRITTRGEA